MAMSSFNLGRNDKCNVLQGLVGFVLGQTNWLKLSICIIHARRCR
jgi:hypothetical protein